MRKIKNLMFIFCFLILLTFLLVGCTSLLNTTDSSHLRQLKDQASVGDPESQYQLGILYTTEGQWSWDKAKGYRWFLKAAEAGHVAAQYMIGMDKLLGQGTGQDEAGAILWLTRAAQQGHHRSQYQLGQAYLNATGVEKDLLWGRYWLEQAAFGDHAPAQLLLAALFKKGLGGQKDDAEAWAWLTLSERNGNNEAKLALKNMSPLLSKTEKQHGNQLLKRVGKIDKDNLYLQPKILFIQTSLNHMGINAGKEDGVSGLNTQQAIDVYLLQKKLPRDTSINNLMRYLRGKD